MVQVGTGTTTSSFLPLYTCYGYNYSQQIYTAAEISAAGGFAGSVSKLRFYYNAGGTTITNWNSWTVFMGNTGLSNFAGTSSWVSTGSMTQVFSGTITPVAANWMELTLSTPFVYTGGNLVIAVDENSASWSCTAAWRSFTTTAAAGPRSLLYYSDGTNPDPNAPPTANYSNTTDRSQFQMDITSLSGCSGTTAPGATTGPSSICPGASFTVGITNTTSGSGVTYAWERDNGGGYVPFGTNAPAQTVSQTTATSYRCTVTCSGFGALTSTPLAVAMNGYLGCYCIPSTNSCTGGDHITNVTLGTINNTTGQCITTATYSDYTSISTTLNQTANVPISVSVNYGGTEYAAAWIDYDQSGTFDNTEFLTFAPGTNMGAYWLFNGTASVPGGAVLGETRMRVRSRYSATMAPTDACTDGFSYGETEDYKIFIAGPPACVSPAVSNSNVTANSADISWTCGGCTGVYYVEYGLTGFSPGSGAAAGGGTLWTGGPVAGGPVTITGLSSTLGYTVYVRQDCGGGNFSANSGTSFTTLLDCSTAPVIACGASTSFSIPAGTGVWNLGPVGCPGSGAGFYCTPGVENVWQFTAAYAGTYTLVTTATNSTYVDFFFKPAPGTCDASGWTYIDDVIFAQSFNFTVPVAGTYYLVADPEGTAGAAQTFSIQCPLPCATPQFPFAQNVTSTTAQIAWTCTGCTGSNFTVEYGLSGFTPGTGTVISSATSPASITGLSITTPYQAYVTQDCNNVGDGLSNPSAVVSFTTLAPPPANDQCADAVTVTCGSVISGNNIAATSDGLPSQSGTFPVNIETGVWYKYVGDDQQVTLDLCASTLDTRVHVFRTTTDCSSLTPFGGNDDNCGLNGWRSFYTFGAVTGFTYYIAVDGYGSSTGSFSLSVICAPLCTPTVANDLCIDRQLITMGTNCVQVGGNLGCATSTGGANPACIGGLNTYPDAYFEFEATGVDAYVNLVSANPNLRFVVYAGTSCATTPEFYCSPVVTSGVPTLITGLTIGASYTLRVLQPIANAGTFSLCVQKLDVSDVACAPVALTCGDQRYGRTVGRLNNIPAGACPFNGAASTGGVNFFSYTALADEDVTFSTCGLSTFDSRISAFTGDCSALVCDLMDDNAPGCPNSSSTVQIRAVTGQTYTIMVHGAGAAQGDYQIIVFCEPYCSSVEANDRCLNAESATMWTAGDPLAVNSDETLACSYLDGPTSCSAANAVQGVWYTLTTNANNTDYDVYLATNVEDPLYTAPNISLALFSGGCSNVGASGEMLCVASAGGSTQLPPLATNTTYRLLVYNQGGLAEGTFGMLVSHPAYNDGGITAVSVPSGTVCDQRFLPVVTLTNFGEGPLSSARIISRIDGGIVQTYEWSGPALATGESVSVTLPQVSSPSGLHDYTAEVVQANGVADELLANSALTSNYDATGQTVVVTVRTDNSASQTTWAIYDPFFFPVATGGPYTGQNNQVITTSVCLATTFGNCFYFYMFDQAGDGIATGYWNLTDSQSRMVLQDNGTFGLQSPSLSPASPIYFAHEFCLPLGPSPIQAAECNVFNNYLNNKVYTTAVAGVSNYQFEFSDPNAGFYRRISLARNWVKFGEMVSNPLVYGRTYFCRARADQGSTGFGDDFYGAGCEMALANVQPICTELISTPGATFSCGVTKRFNGSDKIWAQPVTYATQYRFSFVGMIDIDGPNPLPTDTLGVDGVNDPPVMSTRNITRTSYVCPLSWASYQLVNGQTYNVSVDVFVGGAWSGYCGGVCTVTIQNPPAQGGGHSGRTEVADASEKIQLWPNPVRDGKVNLLISDLADATQKISIDVYDVYGKRVMAEHYENAGVVFNQVLDLDQSMSAGMYMVNITVNDELFVQRLSVVR